MGRVKLVRLKGRLPGTGWRTETGIFYKATDMDPAFAQERKKLNDIN